MKRLFLIVLFALLMLAVIFIWSKSYYTSQEEAYVQLSVETEQAFIPSEKGVFERAEYALDYAKMPEDKNHQRTLKTYYNNRAFHGAPPSIPHPIIDDLTIGEKSCLKCHQNGGYVSKFKAYAPVVPHPEKVNCRQCHVTENTKGVFRNYTKQDFYTPIENNAEFVGGPPVIPHQIQLHENCLACHAGPAAPKEIRVIHPERSNCRQCHVVNNKELEDIGNFIR